MLNRLREKLKSGVPIPGTGLKIRLEKEKIPDANPAPALLQDALFILSKFPELHTFYHSSVETSNESCNAFLETAYQVLPIFNSDSTEVLIRRNLIKMKALVCNQGYLEKINREIAISNLRDGVTDRALSLRMEVVDDSILELLENNIRTSEKHKAAKDGYTENLKVWESNGDIRANSLIYYFEKNPLLLKKKKVLHVAPEVGLLNWIKSRSDTLEIEYVTLDPFSLTADLKFDLRDVRVSDESFDYIICHRVLEHVQNDTRAIQELFRILKYGGTLNTSVPQSFCQAKTKEWIVPDSSHDDHVRHYGRDFPDRLASQGFAVKFQRDLLDLGLEHHRKLKTYPFAFYICIK